MKRQRHLFYNVYNGEGLPEPTAFLEILLGSVHSVQGDRIEDIALNQDLNSVDAAELRPDEVKVASGDAGLIEEGGKIGVHLEAREPSTPTAISAKVAITTTMGFRST